MNSHRNYTLLDRLCLNLDQALRALSNTSHTTGAAYPAATSEYPELTEKERKHAAGLMRVNHTGEICAQALYHGQGLVSREEKVKEKMHEAAIEEGDHLQWCKLRLDELQSHSSWLNPFWYTSSFCLGMLAGMVGDKWSLGFLAETEEQVVKHLNNHMAQLPANDYRSQLILKQMEKDEAKHQAEAMQLGASTLPAPVRVFMRWTSKIMVKTAYYV